MKIKKYIPKLLLDSLRPIYHWCLSWLTAYYYDLPGHKLRIIAVTGTKGKTTVVVMLKAIFETAGYQTATSSSLGFSIHNKNWPNQLKMTMPGPLYLQKFLWQAQQAKVDFVIMEVTSEGIAQYRLNGIKPETAVMTNVRPEHLESHGSFQAYLEAKQQLFNQTRDYHVLNAEDPHLQDFTQNSAVKTITYGQQLGHVNKVTKALKLSLLGNFNETNALATLAVAEIYAIPSDQALAALAKITIIPGRMERIKTKTGFEIIIDYAHTPDSLTKVYEDLRTRSQGRLLCVLGSAGGGRDRWKRPLFGKLAQHYCDEVIFTNEDPYDERPETIIAEIISELNTKPQNWQIIIDRKQAIANILAKAKPGDTVVITGKGSELSMALANDQLLDWSDKETVIKILDPLKQKSI